MGWLREPISGMRVPLEAVHLVGRTKRCALLLDDSKVSHEHASLRWNGDAWTIRDLGSLNRTTVDGRTLATGEVAVLKAGSKIAFGADTQCWILDTADPPCVMAVPLAGGPGVVEHGGLLALPSVESPLVTICRAEDGSWFRDGEGTQPLADQDVVEVGSYRYRFCLPQVTLRTSPVRGFEGRSVSDVAIQFCVSSDLEHIELVLTIGEVTERLPARSHNEMLLLLARERQRDHELGLPAPNCGWRSQDVVAKMLHVDPEHLNVQVFRVRRQFGDLGLVNPAQIIERRPRNRHLRIGVARSEETTI